MRRPGNRPGRGVGPGRHAGVASGLDVPIVTFIDPNSGRVSGGTAVTIRGQNFRLRANGGAPVVTINGVAATNVVVVNSTTITAVTGLGTTAGLGDVSVDIDGLIGTFTNAFTYYTSSIISITPVFGPFSGGTAVMIFGNNFVEGSVVTFEDEVADDIQFIDEAHISCVTPPHAVGFVDVKVIEPT